MNPQIFKTWKTTWLKTNTICVFYFLQSDLSFMEMSQRVCMSPLPRVSQYNNITFVSSRTIVLFNYLNFEKYQCLKHHFTQLSTAQKNLWWCRCGFVAKLLEPCRISKHLNEKFYCQTPGGSVNPAIHSYRSPERQVRIFSKVFFFHLWEQVKLFSIVLIGVICTCSCNPPFGHKRCKCATTYTVLLYFLHALQQQCSKLWGVDDEN